MQWSTFAKGWNAGAVMADSLLNRRQTVRVGDGVAFAQVGIVGFDGRPKSRRCGCSVCRRRRPAS